MNNYPSLIKKSLTRLIATITSVMIVLSLIPGGLTIAETSDQQEKIDAFKTAWQNLRVVKTELFAVPYKPTSNVTADNTEFTQAEKDALGPYYYYTDTAGETLYMNPETENRWGYPSYAGKENLKFIYNYKLDYGDNTDRHFELVFENNANKYYGIWIQKGGTDLINGSYNAVEGSRDISNTHSIIIKNPVGHKIIFGCIYVSYYESVALPTGYETFTAKEWIEAAESLDLTNCASTVEFKNALAALRELTEEGKAFNKLYKAWSSLLVSKTELYAIPHADYRYSTAELSNEEKAAFGEYYYQNPSGSAEHNYTPPVGQTAFIDYSGKSNVKYTFKYKQDTVGNFQVKLSYTKTDGTTGNINSWNGKYAPYSDKTNTILTYTLDTAGTDISKNLIIRLNPNGRKLTAGCIYVIYDEPIDMPENCETMSLRDFVKAAKKLDLSQFPQETANGFNAEIAAASNAIEPIVIDVERAEVLRQNLISAWQGLTYYEDVLWAIPEAKYRKETTEEAAQAVGLTVDQLGKYYCDENFDAITQNTLNYTAPDGSYNFDTLTDAEKITFYCIFKDDDGNVKSGVDGGKVNMQFNVTDSVWPNSWVKSVSVSKKSSNFAGYFDGSKKVTGFKFFREGGSIYNNIVISSVFKTAIKTEELPYGYEETALPVLVDYASQLDLTDSKYNEESALNFKNALNDAKSISGKMLLQRTDILYKTFDDANISVDPDFTVAELIEFAMSADLSVAENRDNISEALWQLRLYTADGAAINNLKAAWSSVQKALPDNFAQLSVEKWIEAAEKIGEIADSTLKDEFDSELRQLKYYSTGIPDIVTLKNYIDSANTMDAINFVKSTWNGFSKQVYLSNEVINNPSAFTQKYADERLDGLLEAWGNLKYYSRTLYVDFNDYYTGDPDVSLRFAPRDQRNTYVSLLKDVKLPNGVDRAIKVVNVSSADGVMTHGGKKLMPLTGYSALEFYIDLSEFDMPNGYASFGLQLMNGDGTEWNDYYFSITKAAAEDGWVRCVVPIKSFNNYVNGKRQEGIYMNENGFIVSSVRVFLYEGASGTYRLSSIAALKENDAKAGAVPKIEPISVYRPPEIIKVPPKNPFTGVDRGDPWGDEYRKTHKNDNIEDTDKDTEIVYDEDETIESEMTTSEEETSSTTKVVVKKKVKKKGTQAAEEKTTDNTLWIIFAVVGAAVVIAAITTLLIVIKKRKKISK